MAFESNIIITSPDGLSLVVDAKLAMPDLELTERELKSYMFGMRCPLGLLITPERMWLYRDFYTSRSPESVQRVGVFNTKPLWKYPPPAQKESFEIFVQQWLEYLASQPLQKLPTELREALQEYLLPAVAEGEVRAGHPRYS